jgi:drug/metabolite transporter (DMT)-like permease
MLVFVTLCWGVSFTLMKDWHDHSGDCPGGPAVAGLTMIALRMAPALAVLAVVQPHLFWRPTRRAHRAGFFVGLAFFAGFALQVMGLARTTPARSGFVTSLSSAFVPAGMWLFFRTRVPLLTTAGMTLGVVGAGLLSFAGTDEPAARGWINPGDALTLVAAFFFMGQVILLDRLGRSVEPGHITGSFFATGGFAALGVLLVLLPAKGVAVGDWLAWIGTMLAEPLVTLKLGALVIFSTVLAFGLMNAYQPRVPASRAALIYLLESLFSSAVSVAAGFDRLTSALLLGGGLILGGNLLVELPNWWRSRRLNPAAPAGVPEVTVLPGSES